MPEEKQCSPDYCPQVQQAAEDAVRKVFAILGVDVDVPKEVEEFRENLRFGASMRRAATLPVGLYLAAYANTIQFGSQFRFNSPVINGDLNFAYDDGITSYNKLNRSGLTLFAQQTGGSSGDLIVFGIKDNAGNVKFQFRNDGHMSTAGCDTATAVATIKGVLPIYTEANVLWGYVPVYTTYTP